MKDLMALELGSRTSYQQTHVSLENDQENRLPPMNMGPSICSKDTCQLGASAACSLISFGGILGGMYLFFSKCREDDCGDKDLTGALGSFISSVSICVFIISFLRLRDACSVPGEDRERVPFLSSSV